MDNVWMLDLVILAGVAIAVVCVMLWKRGDYQRKADAGILADIWLPNGKSHFELVRSNMAGWVKVGKAMYRLSVGKQYCKCGHEIGEHEMVEDGNDKGKILCNHTGCECQGYELATTIPNVRRKTKYPSRPFLGLAILQADVRTESWYLNNPEPITWADNRTYVTALDSYVLSREMTAEQTAAEINETEARQRQWMEAISKIPDKMVLYILIGIAIVVGIVGLVHTLGITV